MFSTLFNFIFNNMTRIVAFEGVGPQDQPLFVLTRTLGEPPRISPTPTTASPPCFNRHSWARLVFPHGTMWSKWAFRWQAEVAPAVVSGLGNAFE